ncbi:hypothetical protein AS850_10980 [Frondihabitans sp. 762G35]|uniref:heparan-alpha-glucosaminide N-acetyltransferase domain-containing protein n=1 Tax=Frondihabitans sp. 762G35 TaxID=1446794 RepID=UPI000D20B850|nr:heparan-alpha-glucosaminide N-acetyltransferase domain-containing protein [Frondihabitans sp. 762G35]ARC57594.1 hypothetical protein AS850_10980 [Frondihabitans sp. 762G35]
MTQDAPAPTDLGPVAPAVRSDRIVGIDLARAIALLGMFAAHLVDVTRPVDWADPSTWWSISSGRSSVLFAVVAGVSLALLSGGSRPFAGHALATARRRIAVRGGIVFAIGTLLVLLEPPVSVILPTYGLLFVLLLPVLRWSRSALLVVAGIAALLSIPALLAFEIALPSPGPFTQQFLLVYPVVTWIVYVLVGLAIGRSLPSSPPRIALVGSIGAGLAVVAYGVGEVVTPGGALYGDYGEVRLRDLVFASEPHSSTLVDVVGSLGVALGVIAVCLLVAPRAGRAVAVVARLGAMPLTIYTVHVVILAGLQHSGVLDSLDTAGRLLTLALFALGALLFAGLWGARRGPLESLVARVANVGSGPRSTAAPR